MSILKFSYLVIIAILVCSVVSCSTLLQPRVPGVKNLGAIDHVVPTSEIVLEVKRELATAFHDIQAEKIRRGISIEKDNDPFFLYTGNANLTGLAQNIVTDTGSVSGVIPIEIYAGSVLSPRIELSRGVTSSQEQTLSFSVDPLPATKAANSKSSYGEPRKGPIYQAVYSAFQQALIVDAKSKMKGDPEFENKNLSIRCSFAVTRNWNGSVSSTLLVPAIDLNQLLPTASEVQRKSQTHTLLLNLPLNFDRPDPDDSRRMLYGQFGETPVVLIDEPFKQERYDTGIGRLKEVLRELALAESQRERAAKIDGQVLRSTIESLNLEERNLIAEALEIEQELTPLQLTEQLDVNRIGIAAVEDAAGEIEGKAEDAPPEQTVNPQNLKTVADILRKTSEPARRTDEGLNQRDRNRAIEGFLGGDFGPTPGSSPY